MDILHKAAYRDGLGNSLYSPAYRVGSHTPDMLREFVKKHFDTNNVSIVGVGINHEELMHMLQHKLHLGNAAGSQKPSTPAAKYYGGKQMFTGLFY